MIKVNKKQKGIERPTSTPTLNPIEATTKIIINNTAARIFPCSSDTNCSVITVSSSVITISKLGGNLVLIFDKDSLMAVLVSRALAPSLKKISMEIASSPLILAYSSKSIKVLFTEAMSPKVTIAF